MFAARMDEKRRGLRLCARHRFTSLAALASQVMIAIERQDRRQILYRHGTRSPRA